MPRPPFSLPSHKLADLPNTCPAPHGTDPGSAPTISRQYLVDTSSLTTTECRCNIKDGVPSIYRGKRHHSHIKDGEPSHLSTGANARCWAVLQRCGWHQAGRPFFLSAVPYPRMTFHNRYAMCQTVLQLDSTWKADRN